MTADAVSTPVPPPHREQPSAAVIMMRLIRESFAVIEPRTEEAARFFYGLLFSLAPATRELFPANMEIHRNRLFRALLRVVRMVDRPDELIPYLHQLGRDHRKYGTITDYFEVVGVSLIAAVREYAREAWTPEVERAWADAYTIAAGIMREAAESDQGPAWWNATVVEHERLSWDLAVVRLRPEQPIPYRAGQYVSVEVPQRPRLWRYLSPANAPRPDGQIEFHVRAVQGGWVSPAIVGHGRPGDPWRIGPAMGRLAVDRKAGRPVLMIAGGTGVTPMRAMLEELSRWGGNPPVHLFYGGRTMADLYDLENLQAMASTNPWLTVVPAVENDPVPGVERGTLADVVTSYGVWVTHSVLVCGSPAMIRATVAHLLVAGTPLDHIKYDPFTQD